MTLRERDGPLWISATIAHSAGASDRISGQEAVRVLDKGIDVKLTNQGHPRLIDQAGNVWLNKVRGKHADVVNLWRDGKIRQTLRIPAYTGGMLFSDRPGSVYAMTAVGLQHLKADGPDYGKYHVGQAYATSGLAGSLTSSGYTKQGYLVFTSFLDFPKRSYVLRMLKLPKP